MALRPTIFEQDGASGVKRSIKDLINSKPVEVSATGVSAPVKRSVADLIKQSASGVSGVSTATPPPTPVPTPAVAPTQATGVTQKKSIADLISSAPTGASEVITPKEPAVSGMQSIVPDEQVKGFSVKVQVPIQKPQRINPDVRRTNPPVRTSDGKYAVDDHSLDAIKWKESNFGDPRYLKSRVGAAGPYQIMPHTAKHPGFGVKPLKVTDDPKTDERYDEAKSRAFAKSYYEAMLSRYDGDTEAALAAYNWGVKNADDWVAGGKDRTKLPAETLGYITTLAPTLTEQEYETVYASVDNQAKKTLMYRTAMNDDVFKGSAYDRAVTQASMFSGGSGGAPVTENDSFLFIPSDNPLFNSIRRSTVQILRNSAVGGVDLLNAGLRMVANVASSGNPAIKASIEASQQFTDPVIFQLAQDYYVEPLMGMADSIPYNPSKLKELESGIDYFTELWDDPASAGVRAVETVGELIPQVAQYMLLGAKSKLLARSVMFLNEIGSFSQQIEHLEQAGVEISEDERMVATLVGGAIKTSLEMFGLGKMTDVFKAPGIRGKISSAILSGAWNSVEEVGQDVTDIIAEYGLTDEMPQDIGLRITRAAYSGMVGGFAMSSSMIPLAQIAQRNTPDTEYLGTITNDQGVVMPRFRVLKPGESQGKTMTLDEARTAGLDVSGYAEDAVRQTLIKSDKKFAEQPHAAESIIQILKARATTLGMRFDEFYDTFIGTVKVDPNNPNAVIDADFGGRVTATLPKDNSVGGYIQYMGRIFGESLTTKEKGAIAKMAAKQKISLDVNDGKQVGDYMTTMFHAYMTDRFKKPGAKKGEFLRKDIRRLGAFNIFKDFMLLHGVTSAVRGYPLGRAQVDLMNRLFDEIDREGTYLRQQHRKTGLVRSMVDALSLEKRFTKIGLPKVGRAAKLFFSYQDAEVSEAKYTLKSAMRKIGNDTKRSHEVVFLMESDQAMKDADARRNAGLMGKEEQNVHDAAIILRTYFDQKLLTLQLSGVVHASHKDQLKVVLEEKIYRLGKKGQGQGGLSAKDTDKLVELLSQLENVEDALFSHIPLKMWFMSSIGTPQGIEKFERALSYLVANKRTTVKVKDLTELKDDQGNPLLNLEDINLVDIMASYGDRVGNDLALSNMLNAAIDEGAARKFSHESQKPVNDRPPAAAYLFKQYDVHNYLNNWINRMARSDQSSFVRTALNVGKFLTFAEATLLASYNVIQLGLGGLISPIKMSKAVVSGAQSFFTRDASYYEALNLGIASQSFRTTFRSTLQDFTDTVEGKDRSFARAGIGALIGGAIGGAVSGGALTYTGAVLGAAYLFPKMKAYMRNVSGMADMRGEFKTMNAIQMVTQNIFAMTTVTPLMTVMNTISDFAWSFDHMTRQMLYDKYLLDGLNKQDAAQLAAQVFGDYGDVPIETRHKLNLLFYTPTYKIAMFKLYGESAKNVLRVAAGTSTNVQQASAMIALNLTALVFAADYMFTTGFGWERDEFGRRYRMRVQSDVGPKDVMMVFSGPHDLITKYVSRADQAFNDPTVNNQAGRFAQLNRYEFHPVWRFGQEFIQNEAGMEPIYGKYDSTEIKAQKTLMHGIKTIVGAYKKFAEEEFNAQGTELFIQQYDQFTYNTLGVFLSVYSRDPDKIRLARNMERRVSTLKRDLGLDRVKDVILNGPKATRAEDIKKVLDEAIGNVGNFEAVQQHIIRKLEEAYYDPADYNAPRDPNGRMIKNDEKMQNLYLDIIKFLDINPDTDSYEQ